MLREAAIVASKKGNQMSLERLNERKIMKSSHLRREGGSGGRSRERRRTEAGRGTVEVNEIW